MRIGITERGDGGLDFSWENKLNIVDGCIVISKCNNSLLTDALIRNKDKNIIYHATCTGLGGSILEPNVPNYRDKLSHIEDLINKGFRKDRIVLRIDPIIDYELFKEIYPNKKNIDYIKTIDCILQFAINNGIERIRYSYIDIYPHIIKRFKEVGIKHISSVNNNQKKQLRQLFNIYREKYNLTINSCGEEGGEDDCVGCISEKDFKILGIDYSSSNSFFISRQRKSCKCLSEFKFELLKNKVRCLNKCLYCYWKDDI